MKIYTIKKVFPKTTTIFIAVLIAFGAPISIVQKVSADQYDDRIAALQRDIDSYNAQATQLASQARTLQSAVASLRSQAEVIQAQINISQAKYDKLVAQITSTEKQIRDNQDALGKTIASMYVDDRVTPLEMLASSKNISDYLDKQEYRTSVRTQLTSTITRIKALKLQLNQQKTDVRTVLDKQQAQRASLVATQNQQQDLLNQTQGQEAAYQQLVASNQQKLAAVAADQRAYYQKLLNSGKDVNSGVSGDFAYAHWSGNQGCNGGYPWDAAGSNGSRYGCAYPLDGTEYVTYIDSWQLYNRECVSYAAWAIDSRFNKIINGFNGAGMPNQWIYNISATRVYNPQPGDAVILPPTSDNFAPVGHLMVVESIDNSREYPTHVSQFNFYGTGEYSTMDIKNSGVIFLRFQNR